MLPHRSSLGQRSLAASVANRSFGLLNFGFHLPKRCQPLSPWLPTAGSPLPALTQHRSQPRQLAANRSLLGALQTLPSRVNRALKNARGLEAGVHITWRTMSAHRRPPPQHIHIHAVAIGSDHGEYEHLQRIFSLMQWELRHAALWESALALPGVSAATHFFFAYKPNDEEWIHVLEAVKRLPGAPAFILTSRIGDERLWGEVLSRGGYDLLLTPFEEAEVIHTVAASRRHSLRQPVRLCAKAG